MEQIQALISSAIDGDEPTRRAALRDLVGHGPELAPVVVAAWRTSRVMVPDPLAVVIIRWPAEEVVRWIAPYLDAEVPGVAVRAGAILGRTRHVAAVAPLADALDRPAAGIAVDALGRNGVSEGIAPLRQFLGRLIGDGTDFGAVEEDDPSTAGRIAATVEALARLGDDSHAPWLIPILRHAEEISARGAAATALRLAPVAGAVDALAEAVANDHLVNDFHNRLEALYALWSYRTVEALDAVMALRLEEWLSTDVEAMFYDIAAFDAAETQDGRAARWSLRRDTLPSRTCLLAGRLITVNALVERVRVRERSEMAVNELALQYGFRPRHEPLLDPPSALVNEVEEWARAEASRFIPGRMYRFGREVLDDRLPHGRLAASNPGGGD